MKKRSLGLLIALALLLPAALAQATTTTVMMYMCGTRFAKLLRAGYV